MNGELILNDTIYFDEQNKFDVVSSYHDFGLSLFTNSDELFEDALSDKNSFKKSMIDVQKTNQELELEDDLFSSKWEYIDANFENILNNIEYIKFNFEKIDIKDYIKKNPILLTKKIVLPQVIGITEYDKLLSIAEEYEEFKDIIYISLIGNNNYVSINDCFKTIEKIKDYSDKITKLNLSPMETIMYVYDQVRNRVYTHEDESESKFKSRDLTDVLFGDKIVCAGYSNIFYTILSYIGINNYTADITLKDESSAHQRNIIYVNDPKYNIDGVYYFDPTWESKENENDNSYLYSYKFFAKTRSYMEKLENYNFKYERFDNYSDSFYEEIKDIVMNKNIDQLIRYIRSINYMSKTINQKRLIKDEDLRNLIINSDKFDKYQFLEEFKSVYLKYNRDIPAETMIKLLINVRKIEYYQDSEWYPYDINAIYKAFIKSNWDFENTNLDEMKLLSLIFGHEAEFNPANAFKNYIRQIDAIKEIKQVQLTKVLQKHLENKKHT